MDINAVGESEDGVNIKNVIIKKPWVPDWLWFVIAKRYLENKKVYGIRIFSRPLQRFHMEITNHPRV